MSDHCGDGSKLMFDMLVAENLVDLIEEEGLRRSFSRIRA